MTISSITQRISKAIQAWHIIPYAMDIDKKNIYNQDDKTFGNLHHDYAIVIEKEILTLTWHIISMMHWCNNGVSKQKQMRLGLQIFIIVRKTLTWQIMSRMCMPIIVSHGEYQKKNCIWLGGSKPFVMTTLLPKDYQRQHRHGIATWYDDAIIGHRKI